MFQGGSRATSQKAHRLLQGARELVLLLHKISEPTHPAFALLLFLFSFCCLGSLEFSLKQVLDRYNVNCSLCC